MEDKLEIKKHSDLIYDVGLHKGEDTNYYLKKGFRVVAFEADPELIEGCKKEYQSQIESGQLVIVEGAIAEPKEGQGDHATITFYKNHQDSEWGTVDEAWVKRNDSLGTTSEKITVAMVDFSACLKKYGMPFYLKIDIEGMDMVCLKSLGKFKEKPDYISIESEKVSFKGLKMEMELFDALGYHDFKLVNQADIAKQKEPDQSSMGGNINYAFKYGQTGLFGSDLPHEWMDRKQAIASYRKVFWGYRMFGDKSFVGKTRYGQKLLRFLSRKMGRSIPGWYDTHARLS